jgi:hypothetical protein
MTRYEPYKEGDKHVIDTDPDDKLIYLWNVTKFCEDNSTEVESFVLVTDGVEVLEKGTPQGPRNALLTAKCKVSFDTVQEPFGTARVTTTDGQQFDKTIWFKKVEN